MTATKLTLRIDDELVQRAKEVAREREVSVSRLVADYFSVLGRQREPELDLPPITASLHGIAAGADVDEEDYRLYLEQKYL